MLIFFLFVTALTAFTFGFATACIMATAGHAEGRDERSFLPDSHTANRGAPSSPIRPPRAAP